MDIKNNVLFRVAIYLRLSKEDGNFSSNGKFESNSINSQREIIMNYLKEHPEMEIYDEYKDDGKTGTNFERSEFQRMYDDIKSGKVNCIIVKDLSRFGRDYIDCGRYIEKEFPSMNVRFIAINDGFDNFKAQSTDNIVLPFKNLINDSYSRDISIKIRSNLEIKRKQGEFISSFAVYGYKKHPDNKNQLIVDEYAAEVVKLIYKLKMDGLSPQSIADRLNNQGILSPMEYKKSNGDKLKTTFKKKNHSLWSHVAVRRILSNEIYTGVMVQGKRTTHNYKIKVQVHKKSEDWVRVENTHEAIISKKEFEDVKQLLLEDTRAFSANEAVHPFSGRIFCGDCGASAVRKTTKSGDKTYVYYVCCANKEDKNICTKHSIREDFLNEAVLTTIQKHILLLLDMKTALSKVEDVSWEQEELEKISTNIFIQEEIIKKNNELRASLYEDLKDGIISKEDYETLKVGMNERIANAKKAIAELNKSKINIEAGISEHQCWLEQFAKFKNVNLITREVIVSLVEKIYIYEENEVEVVFNYRDEFKDIVSFLEKHQNGLRLEVG